jgi:uncharacterized membrane protein YfcA
MPGVVLGGALAGLALGMLGAGGTIIGLPMFLYFGGPQGHAAFGTNAFGVTVIALLLLLWRVRSNEVDMLPGIAFAVPGLLGIAIGARLGLLYPAAKLIFLLSFLILVVAGWIGYLSTRPARGDAGQTRLDGRHIARIVPVAFVVGLISGFFAIGGGFLVVPGLALAAALDLRAAGRSSLLPITAFAGLDAVEYWLSGDVKLAISGVMIAAGLAGGGIGIVLGNRLPLPTIQRIFAVFLALIGAYMIAQHV